MKYEGLPVPMPGEYDIPAERDLAFEKLWAMWGERAGFSREQFSWLWTDAENQYTDELPHHNFQHAQRVFWDTMCLTDICEAHGITVNRKALSVAALLHDAGFHRDFMQHRFDSKEEYSAVILGALTPRYGLQSEDIAVAKQAVRSTALDATPVSIEDKILGRADMMNVSGDYKTSFEPTTDRLMAEAQVRAEWARGGIVDRLVFKRYSIRAVGSYLARDLSLGPFEDRAWLKRPVANLRRLVEETALEEHLPVSEFIRRLGSSAVSGLLGEDSSEDAGN